jgi:hypothetical protein
MKRKYHNYLLWEEYQNGMWEKVSKNKEEEYVNKALEFMQNTELWGEYMLKVTEKWIYSCEQNLSHNSNNRVAWIGQAACCLGKRIPESITRKAWWHLTEIEKANANKKAKQAINIWLEKNNV